MRGCKEHIREQQGVSEGHFWLGLQVVWPDCARTEAADKAARKADVKNRPMFEN